MESYIFSGLKHLRDTGKSRRWINYEELCIKALGNTDELQYSEWHHYWKYWYARFRAELSHIKRKHLFRELISDIVQKGLLPSKTSGLSGNITNTVEAILQKEQT